MRHLIDWGKLAIKLLIYFIISSLIATTFFMALWFFSSCNSTHKIVDSNKATHDSAYAAHSQADFIKREKTNYKTEVLKVGDKLIRIRFRDSSVNNKVFYGDAGFQAEGNIKDATFKNHTKEDHSNAGNIDDSIVGKVEKDLKGQVKNTTASKHVDVVHKRFPLGLIAGLTLAVILIVLALIYKPKMPPIATLLKKIK